MKARHRSMRIGTGIDVAEPEEGAQALPVEVATTCSNWAPPTGSPSRSPVTRSQEAADDGAAATRARQAA